MAVVTGGRLGEHGLGPHEGVRALAHEPLERRDLVVGEPGSHRLGRTREAGLLDSGGREPGDGRGPVGGVVVLGRPGGRVGEPGQERRSCGAAPRRP